MKTLKEIYHSVELSLFGNANAPLVKLLELLAVAGCPYCSAIRAMAVGYGIGRFDLIGLLIIIASIGLTKLEHKLNADT